MKLFYQSTKGINFCNYKGGVLGLPLFARLLFLAKKERGFRKWSGDWALSSPFCQLQNVDLSPILLQLNSGLFGPKTVLLIETLLWLFFCRALNRTSFSNIVFVIVPLLYANESRNQWPKSSIYYVVHSTENLSSSNSES